VQFILQLLQVPLPKLRLTFIEHRRNLLLHKLQFLADLFTRVDPDLSQPLHVLLKDRLEFFPLFWREVQVTLQPWHHPRDSNWWTWRAIHPGTAHDNESGCRAYDYPSQENNEAEERHPP
jgi:hypothetical protein